MFFVVAVVATVVVLTCPAVRSIVSKAMQGTIRVHIDVSNFGEDKKNGKRDKRLPVNGSARLVMVRSELKASGRAGPFTHELETSKDGYSYLPESSSLLSHGCSSRHGWYPVREMTSGGVLNVVPAGYTSKFPRYVRGVIS